MKVCFSNTIYNDIIIHFFFPFSFFQRSCIIEQRWKRNVIIQAFLHCTFRLFLFLFSFSHSLSLSLSLFPFPSKVTCISFLNVESVKMCTIDSVSLSLSLSLSSVSPLEVWKESILILSRSELVLSSSS